MGKILVVDDDMDCAFLMEKVLKHAGYEVVIAPTGQHALEQSDYNLAIVDFTLPDMDGVRVSTELKKKNSAPIILLTGSISDEIKQKAMEAGCVAFLIKPILPAQFLSMIKQHV